MRQSLRWMLVALLFFAALLSTHGLIFAQEGGQADKGKEEAKSEKAEKKTPPPPEEKVSQTKHSARIGGQEIKYSATAGTILLKQEDGTAKASIFFIAYVRDDTPDMSRRPITFAFNGGPGSSSVWLHLGALGPRRVEMGDVGSLVPPPYKLVDSENSLLDVSDLVFIDPVTTGYSRAISRRGCQEISRHPRRRGIGRRIHSPLRHAL